MSETDATVIHDHDEEKRHRRRRNDDDDRKLVEVDKSAPHNDGPSGSSSEKPKQSRQHRGRHHKTSNDDDATRENHNETTAAAAAEAPRDRQLVNESKEKQPRKISKQRDDEKTADNMVGIGHCVSDIVHSRHQNPTTNAPDDLKSTMSVRDEKPTKTRPHDTHGEAACKTLAADDDADRDEQQRQKRRQQRKLEREGCRYDAEQKHQLTAEQHSGQQPTKLEEKSDEQADFKPRGDGENGGKKELSAKPDSAAKHRHRAPLVTAGQSAVAVKQHQAADDMFKHCHHLTKQNKVVADTAARDQEAVEFTQHTEIKQASTKKHAREDKVPKSAAGARGNGKPASESASQAATAGEKSSNPRISDQQHARQRRESVASKTTISSELKQQRRHSDKDTKLPYYQPMTAEEAAHKIADKEASRRKRKEEAAVAKQTDNVVETAPLTQNETDGATSVDGHKLRNGDSVQSGNKKENPTLQAKIVAADNKSDGVKKTKKHNQAIKRQHEQRIDSKSKLPSSDATDSRSKPKLESEQSSEVHAQQGDVMKNIDYVPSDAAHKRPQRESLSSSSDQPGDGQQPVRSDKKQREGKPNLNNAAEERVTTDEEKLKGKNAELSTDSTKASSETTDSGARVRSGVKPVKSSSSHESSSRPSPPSSAAVPQAAGKPSENKHAAKVEEKTAKPANKTIRQRRPSHAETGRKRRTSKSDALNNQTSSNPKDVDLRTNFDASPKDGSSQAATGRSSANQTAVARKSSLKEEEQATEKSSSGTSIATASNDGEKKGKPNQKLPNTISEPPVHVPASSSRSSKTLASSSARASSLTRAISSAGDESPFSETPLKDVVPKQQDPPPPSVEAALVVDSSRNSADFDDKTLPTEQASVAISVTAPDADSMQRFWSDVDTAAEEEADDVKNTSISLEARDSNSRDEQSGRQSSSSSNSSDHSSQDVDAKTKENTRKNSVFAIVLDDMNKPGDENVPTSDHKRSKKKKTKKGDAVGETKGDNEDGNDSARSSSSSSASDKPAKSSGKSSSLDETDKAENEKRALLSPMPAVDSDDDQKSSPTSGSEEDDKNNNEFKKSAKKTKSRVSSADNDDDKRTESEGNSNEQQEEQVGDGAHGQSEDEVMDGKDRRSADENEE